MEITIIKKNNKKNFLITIFHYTDTHFSTFSIYFFLCILFNPAKKVLSHFYFVASFSLFKAEKYVLMLFFLFGLCWSFHIICYPYHTFHVYSYFLHLHCINDLLNVLLVFFFISVPLFCLSEQQYNLFLLIHSLLLFFFTKKQNEEEEVEAAKKKPRIE